MISSQVSCEMPWSVMTALISGISSVSWFDVEDVPCLAGLVMITLTCALVAGQGVVSAFAATEGTRFALAILAQLEVLLLDPL